MNICNADDQPGSLSGCHSGPEHNQVPDRAPASATGSLITLDWGTSNLRAALLACDGTVLETRTAPSGIGTFTQDCFTAHFDRITAGWPAVPAIAAGMVGSRQGWHEAPYLPCPVSPGKLAQALMHFSSGHRTIAIVPGLKINTKQHTDIMRGEETQLAGLLEQRPGWSGTVIMPGTHSKWVCVKQGVIENFQTYMTGELFETISNHTILRHSLACSPGKTGFFATKIEQLCADDRSIEGQVFGLRARQILDEADPEQLWQELSALLVMAEINAGQRDGFDLTNGTILVGDKNLTALYAIALKAGGIIARQEADTDLIWPALYFLARAAELVGDPAS